MLIETLQDVAQRLADTVFDLRRYPAGSTPAPGIVAHRGAWDLQDNIENTLKAFTRAQQLGAWAIELDIHFTKDNVPVVHHDPTLERCHRNPGILCDLPFNSLRSAVPAVPALEEVLALKNLHYMLEVKTQLTSEQVKILGQQLSKLSPKENYHLLTLQPELVRESSALPKEAWVLVGDVNLKSLAKISLERELGGVAGHYLFMTDSLLNQLHAKGQKAGSGFLPTKNLFNREWSRGVDWVFTNHLPALAKS